MAVHHVSPSSQIKAFVTLVVSLALSLMGSGAAGAQIGPKPAPDDVALTLFLIGDAGKPDPEGEPVLRALADQFEASRGEDVVVFLGDNIYPKGMPDAASPGRKEMERRIDEQIDVVLESDALGIFLPGNHDWDAGGSEGWQNVLRQEKYVIERGGRRVRWLPPGARPGPSIVDVGDLLRIVVIDTQWFLHGGPKPALPAPPDSGDPLESFRSDLAGALKSAGGRHVVVVAHHPLLSTGPHGGRFTWEDHLFPLRRVHSSLWVPLPVLGSMYVFARKAGVHSQDVSSSAYETMREIVEGAMAEAPPLLHAAGHHHALEVYAGRQAELYLVSGAGIYGHQYPSGRREETLYNSSESGFMRLDIFKDGSLRLAVLTVSEAGDVREAFSIEPRGR